MKNLASLFLACIFFSIGVSSSAEAKIPQKLSKIYSYECNWTFLEADSLKEKELSCNNGMELGLYQAKYSYYLMKDSKGDNFSNQSAHANYANRVCGLEMPLYDCRGSNARLEFALAEESQEGFSVGLSLTAGPLKGQYFVGYAAPLNKEGECDKGLKKIRIYRAYPSSIIHPKPSTFKNHNGSLDSFKVAGRERAMDRFEIFHIQASGVCENGQCPMPAGEKTLAYSIGYSALNPVICAIDPSVIP